MVLKHNKRRSKGPVKDGFKAHQKMIKRPNKRWPWKQTNNGVKDPLKDGLKGPLKDGLKGPLKDGFKGP